MTCAKYNTVARLTGASGRIYTATNQCNCPQAQCPREAGEGYAKCRSVCQQEGHAEIRALMLAGKDAKGGSISVNHWYFCDACREACEQAGVVNFEATGPRYSVPTPGAVKGLEG